jgi:MFS family permease
VTCSESLSNTINYTQVAGIIGGQLFIGLFADRIGRKWGSVMNAAIMFVCECELPPTFCVPTL